MTANDRSLENWHRTQGSVVSMTFNPFSWRLKKDMRASSLVPEGILETKSRFDWRELLAFSPALVTCPPGWFINACSLLGSIGCCRGAPGRGNMPDSLACSAVTFS